MDITSVVVYIATIMRRGRTMDNRETTMACRSLVALRGKPSSISLGIYVKDCHNEVPNSLLTYSHISRKLERKYQVNMYNIRQFCKTTQQGSIHSVLPTPILALPIITHYTALENL